VYYDGESQSEQYLLLPGFTSELMPISDFKRYIELRMELAFGSAVGIDMVEECKRVNDLKPVEGDYYGASEVIGDLREVYRL
jgi:hypothetical protein